MDFKMAIYVVCVMIRKLYNFYKIVIHHKALSWSVTETSISLPCIYYCQGNDRRPQVFTDIWWEMKVYWLCSIKIRRSLWYFTLFVPVVLGQLPRCQPWKLNKTGVHRHKLYRVTQQHYNYTIHCFPLCDVLDSFAATDHLLYTFWYAWTCACIFYHIYSTISSE